MGIDAQTLGRAVKEVRTARGLTQGELAGLAGVTAQYISLIETGRKLPGTETINQLATALGMPGQWLSFLGGMTPQGGNDKLFEKIDQETKRAIMAAIHAKAKIQQPE